MKRNPPVESKGWRSRGYIPHIDRPHLIQLVTIRLHDAVPEALVEKWKIELAWTRRLSARDPRQVALRKLNDKYEDAGCGVCWLGEEKIARIVEQSILRFDGKRYRIIAWCIMPNHAHVIFEIWEGYPLNALLHSMKSYSAHEANRVLDRRGIFWFREYHDRCIRDDQHLANAVEYVENNPVKAGLVGRKEQWAWSSAGRISELSGRKRR